MPHVTAALSVVLSLLLLAPGAALAQEAAAPQPERAELPASLHLVDPPAQPEEVPQLLRVLVLTTGVVMTGTLGGVAGLVLGLVMCTGSGPCSDTAILGLAAGATLSAPLGAALTGALMEGRGSYEGSLAGAVVGAGLGTAATLWLIDDGPPETIALFPVLTVLGAVIGYELSHSLNTPAKEVRFQPVLAVSGQGAALGLGGRF